ncbi:hypothetical protein ACHAQA_000318 [Verticillium albo-atrum]
MYQRPIPCFDAETGGPLFYSEMPELCRFRGLRLLGALNEDLSVQWNMSLVGLQPNDENDEMHLFFEPGHLCYKVDIVIGADGADSIVRRLLVENHAVVDPEPLLTKYVEEVVLMLRMKNKAGHDTAQMFHPIQTMASDKDGLTTLAVHQWEVAAEERAHELIQMSRISTPASDPLKDINLTQGAARRYMLQSICRTPLQDLEPWRTYIEDPKDPNWHGIAKVQRLRQWNALKFDNLGGKATLAGDAAHLFLPYMAVGGHSLINAVWDVEQLIMALGRIPRPGSTHIEQRLDKQEQMLNDYDEDLRLRGREAVWRTGVEAKNSVNQEAVKEALDRDPAKAPVSFYQ